MIPDTVLIDIKTSPLSMKQVLEAVEVLKRKNPHLEIFMDGDAYAIVGRIKPDY